MPQTQQTNTEKKKKPAGTSESSDSQKGLIGRLFETEDGGSLEEAAMQIQQDGYNIGGQIDIMQNEGMELDKGLKEYGPDNLGLPKLTDPMDLMQQAMMKMSETSLKILGTPEARRAQKIGGIGDLLAIAGAAFGLPALMVGGARLSNSANASLQQMLLPAQKAGEEAMKGMLSTQNETRRGERLAAVYSDIVKSVQDQINITKQSPSESMIQAGLQRYAMEGANDFQINTLREQLESMGEPAEEPRRKAEREQLGIVHDRTVGRIAEKVRSVISGTEYDSELTELAKTDEEEFNKKMREKLLADEELKTDQYSPTDEAIAQGLDAGKEETHLGPDAKRNMISKLIGLPETAGSTRPKWKPGTLAEARNKILLLQGVTENDTWAEITQKMSDNLTKRMRPVERDGAWYVITDIVSKTKLQTTEFIRKFGTTVHTLQAPTQVFNQAFAKRPTDIQLETLMEEGMAELEREGYHKPEYRVFTHQFVNSLRLLPEYAKGVFD